MFNVTVLKMKDIIKFFFGITITILVVITINKFVQKNTNDEKKIVQNIKSGLQTLTENSMLQCLDKTIPTITNINEEYKNIANEDDKIKNQDILQSILNTQITTIKGLEIAEEKQIELAKEEENKNLNTNESQENSNQYNNSQNNNENQEQGIQLARNRSNNTSNYKQANN